MSIHVDHVDSMTETTCATCISENLLEPGIIYLHSYCIAIIHIAISVTVQEDPPESGIYIS